MLQLHKGYSILATAGITKKLTQQYIGPFRIVEKVGYLAYRLDILFDWRIYSVFSMAQLEPTLPLAENSFSRLFPANPPPVFVNGDTDILKSFEIEKLLNKRQVKKEKDQAIEYLVRYKGYGPKQNRWYNIKMFENTINLIKDYEASLLASIETSFINKNIDFFAQ